MPFPIQAGVHGPAKEVLFARMRCHPSLGSLEQDYVLMKIPWPVAEIFAHTHTHTHNHIHKALG